VCVFVRERGEWGLNRHGRHARTELRMALSSRGSSLRTTAVVDGAARGSSCTIVLSAVRVVVVSAPNSLFSAVGPPAHRGWRLHGRRRHRSGHGAGRPAPRPVARPARAVTAVPACSLSLTRTQALSVGAQGLNRRGCVADPLATRLCTSPLLSSRRRSMCATTLRSSGSSMLKWSLRSSASKSFVAMYRRSLSAEFIWPSATQRL
jgi:hypothetical protein